MNPNLRRGLEVAGMLLIGDGLMAAVDPRRHARLWRAGPESWRRGMAYFERRPVLLSAVGVAEAAVGFWLARASLDQVKAS